MPNMLKFFQRKHLEDQAEQHLADGFAALNAWTEKEQLINAHLMKIHQRQLAKAEFAWMLADSPAFQDDEEDADY